eukprot:4609191-Ditylum_brightwellii.AAC.1
MLKNVSKEAATHAALDLIEALHKEKPASPFIQIGDRQQNALQELADIFLSALLPPTPPPSVQ